MPLHSWGIISGSPRMQKILRLVDNVAASPSTVLITGESGTGKELIARALHSASRRAKSSFVSIYCGSVPETLLESELFGYTKGSFTGAIRDAPGIIESANGGTLFLDEIGDISPRIQAKLLRVLQEREVRRLGELRSRRVDIRVVAATHRDLQREVRENQFREDLYYRLNVIQIQLPPLRERAEDVPLLCHHFVRHYNTVLSRTVAGLDDGAMKALLAYHWPGNIRELQNQIEKAVNLTPPGEVIGFAVLSDEIRAMADPRAAEQSPLREAIECLERRLITHALSKHSWNRTWSARELGISRQCLIQKIAKYGLTGGRRNGSGEE